MLHRRKNPSKFFHECVVKQDGECLYCKYSDERLFGKWHDHEFMFHVIIQNINRFYSILENACCCKIKILFKYLITNTVLQKAFTE